MHGRKLEQSAVGDRSTVERTISLSEICIAQQQK